MSLLPHQRDFRPEFFLGLLVHLLYNVKDVRDLLGLLGPIAELACSWRALLASVYLPIPLAQGK